MNRRLPLVAMLVLGLGSAASTGCSFDPSIGSSCSQEGRQMNGLVCRNGEWVRQFGADGAAPDTEVPRADGSSGEVGPSPDVPAVDGGPSDTGDDVSGPDDTRSDRPVGSRCTRDRACASGRCESFGARSVCTRPCGNGSPCPGASSTTCFQGTCTPEGFCRDPDGDGYGRGPGCKGPDGCAKCDPKARCKGSGANASCECQSGWIGDGTSCRRDGDGDGLADADERSQYGTDPTRADTDLDGLDDGGEVTGPPTTDPTETDSDGDFLPDGAETNRHGSKPDAADSDGGGRTDGVEVLFFSSDPTRASDDTGGSPSATGSATTLVEPRLRGNQRLLNLKSAENAFYQIVPADWRHFRHDGAINFSSGSRSRGQFRRNQFQTDGSDFWDKRVGNFTAVFSGLLYVPASRTQTTFAVGSEDGFRLRIAKSSNALASAKDGLRRGPGGLSVFRTGPVLKARLDRTMRAFPYELLFFAEPGNEGVEFSSAPGRHDTFKKGPFSLVEATRIAAPELETELEMEDGNGGDLSIGDPIDWRLKIRNTGDAYAWDVWFIPQTFNTLSTPTLKSRPAGARSGTLDFRGNRHDGWVVPVLAPGESVELKLRSDFRQRRRGNAIGQAQVVGRATPKGTIDQFRLRQLRTERLDD